MRRHRVPPRAQRTIGLFRTSDSYIVQSRGWLPNALGGLIWFGAHAAPCTAYVPLAAGMAALPSVTLGHPAALEKRTLFWAIRYLANLVQVPTTRPLCRPLSRSSARSPFRGHSLPFAGLL